MYRTLLGHILLFAANLSYSSMPSDGPSPAGITISPLFMTKIILPNQQELQKLITKLNLAPNFDEITKLSHNLAVTKLEDTILLDIVTSVWYAVTDYDAHVQKQATESNTHAPMDIVAPKKLQLIKALLEPHPQCEEILKALEQTDLIYDHL
jgi:hypothetical protein